MPVAARSSCMGVDKPRPCISGFPQLSIMCNEKRYSEAVLYDKKSSTSREKELWSCKKSHWYPQLNRDAATFLRQVFAKRRGSGSQRGCGDSGSISKRLSNNGFHRCIFYWICSIFYRWAQILWRRMSFPRRDLWLAGENGGATPFLWRR